MSIPSGLRGCLIVLFILSYKFKYNRTPKDLLVSELKILPLTKEVDYYAKIH